MEAHRDFLIWTVKAYKELQQKDESFSAMDSDDTTEPSTKSAADVEKAEKEERAKLAAERRATIMAQMASAQKSFMSTNAELFNIAGTSSAHDRPVAGMDWQELNVDDDEIKTTACLGTARKHSISDDQEFTCILCSEDSVVNTSGQCMVYSAFIQKSNVLSHKNDLTPAPHTGTCGHVMHAACWTKYFENEVQKENRRPNRNRSPGSFVIDKKEFLCPLCRCLSNAVLPITPALFRFVNSSNGGVVNMQTSIATLATLPPIDFDAWVNVMKKYNWSLQQVCSFTAITEDSMDISCKLPDLKSIVEQFSTWDQFIQIAEPIERNVLSTELKPFIGEFMQSIRRVAPFPYAAEQTEPYLVTWLSCAYTIESLEMCLRAMDKSLKGQMSIRHSSCLSGLIRISGLLALTASDDIAAKLTIQMRSLLDTIFNNSGTSVVEWDIFKMLVSLVFITPTVMYVKTGRCSVPTGNLLEYYYVKLMFAANLAKILILLNENTEEMMDIDDNNKSTNSSGNYTSASGIMDFYYKYNYYMRTVDEAADGSNSVLDGSVKARKGKITANILIGALKRESQTFLRCSTLLFHFMTDIEMPEQFISVGGDTFEVMCEYLGLSTDLESYFKCDTLNEFMSTLAEHKAIDMWRQNNDTINLETNTVPCLPAVRELVSLPDDYSDLINGVSSFTCPNNDRDDTRNPTMCMACGHMLCSMTYCCQKTLDDSAMVGACTYHALNCGAGVGLFLRIRDCEILLLGMNKGCFMSAPYLDEYGETDQGLRRGNPLHLCKERLNKLHLMWLSHGLHEDIARSTETSNSLIATQWQNM